jgi:DNA-binding Lrp family transcriptional regulator
MGIRITVRTGTDSKEKPSVDDLSQSGLDEIDQTMVRELLADGRLSVNALAERTNVSRATAYGRFNRLCDSGVIRGFSALVDPARIGLPITALILVNVEQNSWQEVRNDLKTLPGLEYLAFTSGGFDMVLLVRVPDIVALRDVVLVRLHGSPLVRDTQTIFVLDEDRPAERLFTVPR